MKLFLFIKFDLNDCIMVIEHHRESNLHRRILGIKELFDAIFPVWTVSKDEDVVKLGVTALAYPDVFC